MQSGQFKKGERSVKRKKGRKNGPAREKDQGRTVLARDAKNSRLGGIYRSLLVDAYRIRGRGRIIREGKFVLSEEDNRKRLRGRSQQRFPAGPTASYSKHADRLPNSFNECRRPGRCTRKGEIDRTRGKKGSGGEAKESVKPTHFGGNFKRRIWASGRSTSLHRPNLRYRAMRGKSSGVGPRGRNEITGRAQDEHDLSWGRSTESIQPRDLSQAKYKLNTRE